MIEEDIRELDRLTLARSLEGLEAEIWDRVADREVAKRWSSRLLLLQAVLMGAAFGLSAIAGHLYGARSTPPGELSVFSTHMPLSASTLLDGARP